ncbi:uncharacterized protein B0H18DRAFT_281647 [Fomitopsis serialis]|uniref:uncharacterized protein n=1 Tax=Fomitopsis serialis TaxID=139415 RepID=UPI00200870DB|nr:uncharacterized protein B0H18DRAFT_281647 [Neoantrodia serialis]KAH9927629.1 hypothetical protein B0H18DRAFT_281647 [Neoantrodia serialis]
MAFTEKDFVQLVTYTRVEYYCTMSVLAMVIYDCITRVSSEIDLVWTRRFTPYWLLYFMCRYPPILVMVLNWLRLSNITACVYQLSCVCHHRWTILMFPALLSIAVIPSA